MPEVDPVFRLVLRNAEGRSLVIPQHDLLACNRVDDPPAQTTGIPVEPIDVEFRGSIKAIDGWDRFGLVLHAGEWRDFCSWFCR